MRLSAPKVVTWWIAVILGVIGVIFHQGLLSMPSVNPYVFWIPVVGLALLALGSLFKGL